MGLRSQCHAVYGNAAAAPERLPELSLSPLPSFIHGIHELKVKGRLSENCKIECQHAGRRRFSPS